MLFLGAVVPLSLLASKFGWANDQGHVVLEDPRIIPVPSGKSPDNDRNRYNLCTTHHSLDPLYKVNFRGIRQENIDPPDSQ